MADGTGGGEGPSGKGGSGSGGSGSATSVRPSSTRRGKKRGRKPGSKNGKASASVSKKPETKGKGKIKIALSSASKKLLSKETGKNTLMVVGGISALYFGGRIVSGVYNGEGFKAAAKRVIVGSASPLDSLE